MEVISRSVECYVLRGCPKKDFLRGNPRINVVAQG